MDPKNLSGLDPKLREAYERVMGTSVPPATNGNPNPNVVGTNPLPAASSQENHNNEPVLPQNHPIPAAPPAHEETSPAPVASPSVQMPPIDSAPAATQTVNYGFTKPDVSAQPQKAERTSKISPIIIGVLVVVFLTSYTILWVKVFGVKLPFLP